MRLRVKVILYLVFLHFSAAGLAVYFLWRHRPWLLAVEAFLIFSVIAGVRVFQNIFGPLDLIRTGIGFIRDSDFTTRFREAGQPELDELTTVYNQMIDHLREERVRVREQHHFLSEIIKASPSGILIFDFDGRISEANPTAERMLQTTAGELSGKRLQEAGGAFAEEMAGLHVGESKVIALNGIRRIKCHKSRFLDRNFPRHFLLMEELTEELRKTERAAYEKIIRMMSHEVNNSVGAGNSLLQSCLNYSGQLREEDRHDFETALQVAMSRNQHLNSFMKSYADVIRLPQPELRPCDVRQLLEDLSVLLKEECRERGIQWRWDAGDPPGPVAMDKNQMERVFVNVLRNAIEAIGKTGTITIRMGTRSGRGFVTIEDTGCGIGPEVRANLFTPFFSTKENGRGIGLTMVREILIQHGFQFSLDSAPGGPTQFTVRF